MITAAALDFEHRHIGYLNLEAETHVFDGGKWLAFSRTFGLATYSAETQAEALTQLDHLVRHKLNLVLATPSRLEALLPGLHLLAEGSQHLVLVDEQAYQQQALEV